MFYKYLDWIDANKVSLYDLSLNPSDGATKIIEKNLKTIVWMMINMNK